MTEFAYRSAAELNELILSQQASSVEVVTACLDRLDRLEPAINAFVTRTPEQALTAARAVDEQVARGEALGPLAGVPISVKDLIDMADVPTTFGSRVHRDNVARHDAPAVERVRRAGSCVVGKTTTTEFGCKAGGGDSPLTGVTRNPWNTAMSTGGSSAGAAASVAAGVTPFAVATDGGGSCRIPAALCGLVGVKAQYGRVPVFPTSATPSLAHVGVIARTVRDAAQLLHVLSGFDARDPASVVQEVPDFLGASARGADGLRIAWSPTLGYAPVSAEVREITTRAVERLEEAGCNIETVDRVFAEDPIELWNADFYAGVGLRLKASLDERREILDPAVAHALDEALYSRTLQDHVALYFRRFDLREHFRRFLEPYDLLITPTLPVSEIPAGVNVPVRS